MSRGGPYYHAGPAGLREVLPPSVTGAPSTADFGAEGVCRRDRVYVTTDLVAAIVFASLVPPDGRGVVYEVDPADAQPDPDCDWPGLSFEATRAQIIRRVTIPGKLFRKARKAMRQDPNIQGPSS